MSESSSGDVSTVRSASQPALPLRVLTLIAVPLPVIAGLFYAFSYQVNKSFFAGMGLTLQDVGRTPSDILAPSASVVGLLLALALLVILSARETWRSLRYMNERVALWLIMGVPISAIVILPYAILWISQQSLTEDPISPFLSRLFSGTSILGAPIMVAVFTWFVFVMVTLLRADGKLGKATSLIQSSTAPVRTSPKPYISAACCLILFGVVAASLEVTDRADDYGARFLSDDFNLSTDDLTDLLIYSIVQPDLQPISVHPMDSDPLELCVGDKAGSSRLLAIGKTEAAVVVVTNGAKGVIAEPDAPNVVQVIPHDLYMWRPVGWPDGNLPTATRCF